MSTSLLIVDDDADYRLLVHVALSGHGSLAIGAEAPTTAEAMSFARSIRPDVALFDLGLLEVEGDAPLSRLAEASPKMAFITTSAFHQDQIVAGFPAARYLGHVSKATLPSRLGDEIGLLVDPIAAVVRPVETQAVRLPPDPASVGHARRFVIEVFERWGCREVLDTAALLASELVANAVAHSRTELEVGVELQPDVLRVGVTDHSDDLLHRKTADELDMSGRGVAIVEALSEAWGVSRLPHGKMVWFELARPVEGSVG